ncbi:hypothetical protein [Streptomyces sp. NPDC001604]
MERTRSCPYAGSPSASLSAHHDTGPSHGGVEFYDGSPGRGSAADDVG